MKKTAYVFSLLGMALLTASCNEDAEYFELPDQPDQMHISASVTEVNLEKTRASETAITFTWTKAVSPLSSSDEIVYGLRFYETDQKSEHVSDTISLGSDVTTYSLTHDQLNDIIMRWVYPGERISVTAQLLAYVQNEQTYVKPISSTVTFTATCYEKYSTFLFLHTVDPATGNQKEIKMEQRELGTGVYEAYVENLTACDYYFTTGSTPYPAYEADADGKLKYVETGDDDNPTYSMFSTAETGKRTFIVDVNDGFNDCRVLDIVQLPTPGSMWIVGDATLVGWPSGENKPATPAGMFSMVGSAREPYIYAWTGDFTAGKEFKVLLTTEYSGLTFYAPAQGVDPAENHELGEPRTENGMDFKWVPTTSGRYTFTLYLLRTDLHTSFVEASEE